MIDMLIEVRFERRVEFGMLFFLALASCFLRRACDDVCMGWYCGLEANGSENYEAERIRICAYLYGDFFCLFVLDTATIHFQTPSLAGGAP